MDGLLIGSPWIIKKKYLKILGYQVVFVISLCTYFFLCLLLYLQTLDGFKPKIIRNRNPALMMRPLPTNPYSTLIHFKHGGSGTWQELKESLDDFITPYAGHGQFQGPSETCSWDSQLDPRKRCHVAVRGWFNLSSEVACTKPEAYGYVRGYPCIAFKINRIYGWQPEPYYNISEIEHHPQMPKQLKHHIKKSWNEKCDISDTKCAILRMIWITCEGSTPADVENLGPVSYMPLQGFPGYFYPFLNQQHYLSPVVWIQLTSVYPGVLINIECKIWAKNIQHDDTNPMTGGFKFELMMD